MESVLKHINMVPGVIGSFMCNHDGQPLARSFPPTTDPSYLERASAILGEIAEGLQGQAFGPQLIDRNFDVGRVIVKQIPEGFLVIFCTNSINVQLLAISLNVAQNSITKLMQRRQSQPSHQDPEPQTLPYEKPAQVQLSDRQLRKDGKGVILTIDSMKMSTNLKWNQMEENIAISSKLALEIKNTLQSGQFKKIKLSNKVTGKSKSFSVITFERDDSQLFDDKIVLTLAAAEILQTKPGDEIIAEPVTGGFFGW